MSTVKEIKAAAQGLSPQEQWEIYRWLGESKDVQQFRREELIREISIGVEQADQGDVAPLNVGDIKSEVRQRLKSKSR